MSVKPFYLKENHETTIAVVSDLNELRNSLKSAKDNVISHHVNEENNDFANWINESFNNTKLASKISLISGNNKEIRNGVIKTLNMELIKNSFKEFLNKIIKKK